MCCIFSYKHLRLLIALLCLLIPKMAISQVQCENQPDNDALVTMHLVLVGAEISGDAAAVLKPVTILEQEENVVLIHDHRDGPEIIASAGLELLRVLESRRAGSAWDGPIAISVDSNRGDRREAHWAVEAWRLLQLAGVGMIPGVGAHPVLTLSVTARTICHIPTDEPIIRRRPG